MNRHRQQLIELQHRIFVESRNSRGPLTEVLPWVVDERNLQAAWDRVAEADGAKTPGPDGLSIRDLIPRRNETVRQLSGWIYKGTFRATPPRLVEVPKSTGDGTRKLGVLNVRDRLVHAALKQVLEPILEPQFSNDSFGFRPGRSVPGALVTAVRLLSSGCSGSPRYQYVVKLDVDSCFDTIDHELLIHKLTQSVCDAEILKLVGGLLAAAGSIAGFPWSRRRRGIVQGSGLSPLLCNLYLHALDQQLAELGQQSDGGVRALRYADDLLILARTHRLAVKAVEASRWALRHSRQSIKRSKLSLRTASEGVRWLGVDIRPRENSLEDRIEFGYYIPREKAAGMMERIAEMTTPPSTRIAPSVFDLGRWLGSINEQLTGWWNSYMYAENASTVLRGLDDYTYGRVGELLHAITGLRRHALEEEFRVRLPRGFHTWEVQGTRLKVLSSLAPRNPDRLCFSPPWMRKRGFARKIQSKQMLG